MQTHIIYIAIHFKSKKKKYFKYNYTILNTNKKYENIIFLKDILEI